MVFSWSDDGGRVTSTSLLHVLKSARSKRVRVHAGLEMQGNVRTVWRGYGDTRVHVRFADGRGRRMRLSGLRAAAFTSQAARHERVERLRVLRVVERRVWKEEVRDKLLRTLSTTKAGGEGLLRFMGYKDLEVMWAKVKHLKTVHERESARGRLARRSRQGWGCSLNARPTVRVPMNVVFPRAVVVQAVKMLFRELGDSVRPQIDRLRRRVRYVRARPKTIGQALCNWQPWSKSQYVPGVEPACTCKGLRETKCAENMLEGHLAMRGSNYRGSGWRALHCSHKTVMAGELGTSELYTLTREALRGTVSALPARVRDEARMLDLVEVVMRRVAPTLEGFSSRRTAFADEPSLDDVRVLKMRFKDQIISEIDKERGELCVLCAVTQFKVMESAFPREEHRYDVVQCSSDEIMQKCIDKCVAEKWTDIAPLFGVRKRGGKLVPATCSVAEGYGTQKGKSWKAEVNKGRPISPYTKHCMKLISNAVARAYLTFMMKINTERVTRMFTTQEYTRRLVEDQKRILGVLRQLVGPSARLGFEKDV